ncbi:hypothetical protein DFH09DRAFT_1105803 [Mycena vulgaris]|nr:hypothetical protein DFH09DRAFT_1105803 [Mycena vulgaris]
MFATPASMGTLTNHRHRTWAPGGIIEDGRSRRASQEHPNLGKPLELNSRREPGTEGSRRRNSSSKHSREEDMSANDTGAQRSDNRSCDASRVTALSAVCDKLASANTSEFGEEYGDVALEMLVCGALSFERNFGCTGVGYRQSRKREINNCEEDQNMRNLDMVIWGTMRLRAQIAQFLKPDLDRPVRSRSSTANAIGARALAPPKHKIVADFVLRPKTMRPT